MDMNIIIIIIIVFIHYNAFCSKSLLSVLFAFTTMFCNVDGKKLSCEELLYFILLAVCRDVCFLVKRNLFNTLVTEVPLL